MVRWRALELCLGYRQTVRMHYDIFCKVVDNFGDAAVCWRLAHQWMQEQQAEVRLFIDQPQALMALRPAQFVSPLDRAHHASHGVDWQFGQPGHGSLTVHHWRQDMAWTLPASPYPIAVIEAFACGLPPSYVDQLVDRAHVWVVLEYFSAEDWVHTHHGLPSPHPRLKLNRYYFFPGVHVGTGGLLRASDDQMHRHDTTTRAQRRHDFWSARGVASVQEDALHISLFGYENAALPELFAAWTHSEQPIQLAVCDSPMRTQLQTLIGGAALRSGTTHQCGAVQLNVLPFMEQPQYDQLLHISDCNFVRGEDSLVRAFWAARACVWQAYPQAGRVHQQKVDALLACYAEALEPQPRVALTQLWQAWNAQRAFSESPTAVWQAFVAVLPLLQTHAPRWAAQLRGLGDLASNLARFCAKRLE